MQVIRSGSKEEAMISGCITTRDILSHPLRISWAFGILHYLYFLLKAISPKKFLFTNLVLR
jgi:hypothetical protein